jgi:hypothetical protein
MTLLPFETVIIETHLSKADTVNSLMENIESEKTFSPWSQSGARAFGGQLRGNEFELRRIINYRNSFLPVITGRIETFGSGTRLTVDMRLQMAVLIFMIVWCGLCVLFFVAGSINPDNTNENPLLAIGMLLFGYILTMGGYLFESSRAKNILLDITKGRIVRN